MIHQIKLELGSGLYTRDGNNLFLTPFYDHLINDFEPIIEIPISGEPLITTIFWLKQTMWNHLDSLEWKKT